MTDDAQSNTGQTDDKGSATGASTAGAGAATAGGRIPADVAKKYPQLEALIMDTESMTVEEREYWFQILPIMTDQQVEKLLGILVHEKEQLAKLDSEYEAELSKLNDKHLLEWKESEAREKREQREKAEAQEEQSEQEKEAALLESLDSMDNDNASAA